MQMVLAILAALGLIGIEQRIIHRVGLMALIMQTQMV
jgi:hypothetical protein